MSIDPTFADEGTYSPDNLLADAPVTHWLEDVTILSGEGVLARGTVLGRQDATTVPTTGTADGGNTGDGTMGSVAAGGAAIQAGVYTIRAIEAAADGGVFEVIAPDGDVVGTAQVGVAFSSSHIDFTIADGATDFVVGDQFTVTVSGTGKWVTSLGAAADGSQLPRAILAKDVDATDADVVAPVYVAGGFNQRALTLGAGHTADSIREGLRALNIYISQTVSA